MKEQHQQQQHNERHNNYMSKISHRKAHSLGLEDSNSGRSSSSISLRFVILEMESETTGPNPYMKPSIMKI